MVKKRFSQVKLFGSVIPSSRPAVRSFGKQMGIELPAGNGSWQAVLLTAPLLAAMALVSQLLAPYLATLESLIGCAAGLKREVQRPVGA